MRNFKSDSSTTAVRVIVTEMMLLMVTSMIIHSPVLAPSPVHYHLHLMKCIHCFVLVLTTVLHICISCIFSNDRVVRSNSEQLIVSQSDGVYVCTYFEPKIY